MENGGNSHDNSEGCATSDVETVRSSAAVDTEQLESRIDECIHFTGGSEFNEPLRLRRTKERSPERYKELASQLQELAGDILGTIPQGKFAPTKKYVSTVLRFRDSEHRQQVLRRLRERVIGYVGDIFIWTDEGDHIHFVHDCPLSNGSCRCGVFKDECFRGTFRSNLRGTRYINELDTIDWINVLLYFAYSKWPCTSQIWTRGRLRRSPNSSEIIRWREMCFIAGKRLLESEVERVGHNGFGEEQDRNDGEQSVSQSSGDPEEETSSSYRRRKRAKRETSGQSTSTRKSGKFERILQKVETLLNETAVIPPIHVKQIFAGPDAIELHNPTNIRHYEAACNIWGMKFNRWSLMDLYEFYKDKQPIFYANDIDPFVYYHDRDTSFYYVNELLRWQYNDDENLIQTFLINLQDWFNKFGWNKNPKCNALCVIGPPNAGKNYFFDILAALACNVGHIGRVNNKTNQFALQDCVNKRLVVGNEISMEDGAKEDFKKLCEGTAMNIRVKFQGDQIFTKAPVLLVSNWELDICYDPHFRDIRLATIRWQEAELLKTSTMKPYPLCLFDIYKHYNVFLH